MLSRFIGRAKAISGKSVYLGLLALLPALFCSQAAAAHTSAPAEPVPRGDDVARVIGGIVNFTRWPGTQQHVRLCITIPSEYVDVLMREMPATTRVASVQYLALKDARVDTGCDVVYVEQIDHVDGTNVFQAFVGRPVLSIAGFDSGCLMGSLFCFTSVGSPLTFSANLEAISRSGLRINPKVLFLVRRQAK